MKLWLIEQDHNASYDTYDAAVVAAETEDEAKAMLPYNDEYHKEASEEDPERYRRARWAPVGRVTCTLIGEAAAGTPKCVKCASYNAG